MTSSFQAGGCTAAFFPYCKYTVCLQNLCVSGGELDLHTLNYSYFDYLKLNANRQPSSREESTESQAQETEKW
ncbi:conserved hypothetical protein [Trichinella spiralis]|uniref:hypothetical protein n=1 Tax=Trichinella spiralis TaxID=6334 RepID=UPI0001EFED18|nr:conserved hypothetical protein [Trichinella spiralis]